MNFSMLILVFICTTVIGYKIISNVPSMLHTPLMSGMNALSGITVLGALSITAIAVRFDSELLGAIAVFCAMINIVGGFKVTHRMLKMFKETNQEEKSDKC